MKIKALIHNFLCHFITSTISPNTIPQRVSADLEVRFTAFSLKIDLLLLFIFTPQNLSLMRGQKVYNSIIKDGSISGTIRKGRNNSLISKRNECMIARYYYYGYLRNKGYEEILKLLMSEFYLSPATIAFQVQQQSESLVKLRQLSPTVYYFMNRWPHYKW